MGGAIRRPTRSNGWSAPAPSWVAGGANIGLLTAASVVGPSGAAHAVEVAPATAAMLRGNVARDPELRTVVSELALAEQEGDISFARSSRLGYQLLRPVETGMTITVRGTTLDTLTTTMECVDLVKLGLEGAEMRTLQGGRRC